MSRVLVVLIGLMLAACGDPGVRGSLATSTSTAASSSTITAALPTTSPRTSPTAADVGDTSSAASTSVSTLAPESTGVRAPRPAIQFPGSVAFCDDPPFSVGPAAAGDEPGNDDQALAREALGSVLQGVVDAHPDLFTAMWWDAVSQQFVFSGSERTAMDAAVAASVPKDASYRIEIVARPLADLKELQARLTVAVNDAKVASSSGIRVDGRVEIYLAIREEASVRAVTELAGADVDAVCVSGGADPATVARDGPQTTTGDGWRLLAAARDHPGRTPIEIATTQADYVAMWTHLAFDGGPPAVNLRTEVVLAIVAGESGSCPNRLDSVVFDRAAHLVRPNIVVPRGDRACTADARQRVYVIALQRDHLPDAPFQISARRGECSAGCDGDPITVDPS